MAGLGSCTTAEDINDWINEMVAAGYILLTGARIGSDGIASFGYLASGASNTVTVRCEPIVARHAATILGTDPEPYIRAAN